MCEVKYFDFKDKILEEKIKREIAIANGLAAESVPLTEEETEKLVEKE